MDPNRSDRISIQHGVGFLCNGSELSDRISIQHGVGFLCNGSELSDRISIQRGVESLLTLCCVQVGYTQSNCQLMQVALPKGFI